MGVWDGVDDRAPLAPVRAVTDGEQIDRTGAQLLVRFLFENETWMDDAACLGITDPAVKAAFFPERGYSHRKALEVCATCSVVSECEDYARRTHTEYGVWGGAIRKRGRKNQDAAEDLERELGDDIRGMRSEMEGELRDPDAGDLELGGGGW